MAFDSSARSTRMFPKHVAGQRIGFYRAVHDKGVRQPIYDFVLESSYHTSPFTQHSGAGVQIRSLSRQRSKQIVGGRIVNLAN
jgi:hypothetical protein